MSKKSFSNEYERALKRPDLPDLRMALQSAQKFALRQKDDPEDRGFDIIYNAEDPELLFSVSILAMAEFDDPELIGFIAAGPLEDIFMFAANHKDVASTNLIEQILERIETEARRTARFRWMLSGVWTYSFDAEHARRIKNAAGDADMDTDPLPERPWA